MTFIERSHNCRHNNSLFNLTSLINFNPKSFCVWGWFEKIFLIFQKSLKLNPLNFEAKGNGNFSLFSFRNVWKNSAKNEIEIKDFTL